MGYIKGPVGDGLMSGRWTIRTVADRGAEAVVADRRAISHRLRTIRCLDTTEVYPTWLTILTAAINVRFISIQHVVRTGWLIRTAAIVSL